jgi:hypothetical protein
MLLFWGPILTLYCFKLQKVHLKVIKHTAWMSVTCCWHDMAENCSFVQDSPKKALCYLCLISLSTIFQLYCIAKFLEQETWLPGENYWRVTQTFIIFKLYQAHLVRGCIKHTLPGAASSTHSQGLYQAHPSRGCMKYTLPEAYQVHLARGCIKYTLPGAVSSTSYQRLYQAHLTIGCIKYTMLWPWIKLTNLNGDRLWLYR